MSTMKQQDWSAPLTRRTWLVVAALGAWAAAGMTGCAESEADAEAPTELPPAEVDPDDPFQIDLHITMDTIDNWLNRPEVAYRDLRMFRDPAYYEEIGGSATLDFTLQGFKVIPYPYIGTLQELPVKGAYTGPTLFSIEWDENGEILSATANYEQSQPIIEELFPKDQPLFLMCGGAGYANMMRHLLIYLGWDPTLVYNIGGAWGYTGYNLIELTHTRADGTVEFYNWRADTAAIEFDEYTPVA